MLYHSLTNPALTAQFEEALLSSLAPDGGLFMPQNIPHFSLEECTQLAAQPFAQCAASLARYFMGEDWSAQTCTDICTGAYDFDLPIRSLDGQFFDPALPPHLSSYMLELFHGPTLAFKDFAARFMARACRHALTKSGQTRTILVATSGDTGGAIGESFLHQDGVRVFILYPEGKISPMQEQQLCTIGRAQDKPSNVHAISIEGDFDRCQNLVKQAFADSKMTATHNLMSANSINVGRVIPQSFYYFWTSIRLKAGHPHRPLIYSVPSGNLGNITGALIAKQMGAPIDRVVVGHNANHPFADYLQTGIYTPKDCVHTLSNAMDIGRPNNFPRIQALLGNDHAKMRKTFWSAHFDDIQTENHMRKIYQSTNYIMCPHTAIGHLAMEKFTKENPEPCTKITVATAHPAKFITDVNRILGIEMPVPEALQKLQHLTPEKHVMRANLDALNSYMHQKK